jgi:3',5'-cyclic-AMP phosphodiesterase
MKNFALSVHFLTLFILCTFLAQAQKFGQNPPKVTFGICSDAHLNLMHDAEERLTTFVETMNARQPDFIIELGDFVPPNEKYAHFFEIWNSFAGKTYHVIGNHEPDGGFSMDQVLKDRNMESTYYSFTANGFQFIVLDGNDKKSPDDKPYFNFIGHEQVNWLKNQLAETNYPVVIFSHQALFTPKGEENMGVENQMEIQKILGEHNKRNPRKRIIACFNGHTHYDVTEKIKGIWYITINSMSYNWLGGDYAKVRYSPEVDEKFPHIKHTAPYKEPLFAIVEISTNGTIRVEGRETSWVGPSPWDLGYPEKFKKYIQPRISDRLLKFKKISYIIKDE